MPLLHELARLYNHARSALLRKENTMPLLDEGSPAPAFSVPNQDGETVSLDQFTGKWVVLWWYPRADTPG